MNFKPNKPIYLQIVDFCFAKIMTKEWAENERIPSVRELGVLLQVNPNTAMRAFDYMQSENIIYSKRGMGYYVQLNADKQIKNIQKIEFFEQILPETFKAIDLLEININEIVEKYKEFKKLRT